MAKKRQRKTATFYRDPVTQKYPEGNAELITLQKTEDWNDEYNMETWLVRFTGFGAGEPKVVRHRLIKK